MVSIAGVTGARNKLPTDLGKFINRVKQFTSKPVCVGFGISTPKQAREIAEIADGVIIGSRLIQLIETDDKVMSKTRAFIRNIRKELDKVTN